ncbi:NAD(P)(+)--arginine ADP-ribosyltransferase 2-like [Geospiza fortis]|uniref:NAD(P)(+)--arginine ADP-ribosyltransferase n=1 Tax=Geospiza fortis TaxID=48883 RepID=A0A6I9HT65_GEOFO|nr:NAD(P)(+)--arginine ADP-ribosyltransferase 2-like [Geospiza fortis]
MAPLAQTLALLAMAMATTAVDVIPLDMAPDSFDDQYQGCGPAMKEALLTLSWSEFEQNKKFAEVWVKAAAEWQKLHTCHGVEIQIFTEHPEVKIVLIPPFETFKVTQYTREGDKKQIQFRSTGTFSKYNCEWLGAVTSDGSILRAPFHLGGLLMTTTALAVATRIV